ncbi:ATP-binding protein, partial [Adlercreutzia equolifaciens]|uniref:ATP-binding protein n=1 Tax=Adlercreutzia equolifaciens TaxID=446660 RepID=UPI0039F4ADF7
NEYRRRAESSSDKRAGGRHRKGSLILCSQFAPSGWRAKLGDNAMADAVVDRLVFNSHVMHIEGTESMRKRMSGII